jgi:hypothetical protein
MPLIHQSAIWHLDLKQTHCCCLYIQIWIHEIIKWGGGGEGVVAEGWQTGFIWTNHAVPQRHICRKITTISRLELSRNICRRGMACSTVEISTQRLFYEIKWLNCRGKTDSKFVANAGFLCDEALSQQLPRSVTWLEIRFVCWLPSYWPFSFATRTLLREVTQLWGETSPLCWSQINKW